MRPPSRMPTYVPALILLASILVGLAWLSSRSAPERGPQILTAGGKWELQEISWTEYDGHWRVNLSGFLVRSFRNRINPRDALNGLCGSILVKLPSAPISVERDDIYRVTFNKVAFITRNKEKKFLWSKPLPVQVKNGACQIKGTFGLYYLTYPGGLENWELKDARIEMSSTGQAGERLKLFFVRQAAEAPELPFLEACEAFVADPGDIPVQIGLDSLSTITEIEVLDTAQTDPDFLFFRRYVGHTFRNLDSKCLPMQKEKKHDPALQKPVLHNLSCR